MTERMLVQHSGEIDRQTRQNLFVIAFTENERTPTSNTNRPVSTSAGQEADCSAASASLMSMRSLPARVLSAGARRCNVEGSNLSRPSKSLRLVDTLFSQ